MDRVNDVVKDCLDAVVQLRATEPGQLPPPEDVHQRLKTFVEQMLRKAADVGFSHQDGQDIAFAVVALIDEVALTKGEAMRQHWQTAPLQMHFFNENVAGETFFSRLQALRGDHNRAEALRAYYLCLALGFQGKYRVRGGELELMTLVDGLAKEVQRHRTYDAETLSPSGERPSESLVSAKKIGPLLILSGAAVVLALVVYGGLLVALGVSVGSAKEQIQAVGQTVGAPQAAGEEGR
jgi:type VI secretion system protein ImpK